MNRSIEARNDKPRVRLELGVLVATPGAIRAMAAAAQDPSELIERHLHGDWGILSDEDRFANDRAVESGGRILSAYPLQSGTKLWVITESDQSVTTILLPEEY